MREATPQELAKWDQLVLKNPDGGEVLQTKVWGEFKGRHGWQPRYFIFKFDHVQVAALFLTRQVKGLGQVWYCPKGPGVVTAKQFLQLADMTDTYLQNLPGAPFLVKFEPEISEDDSVVASLQALGSHLQKSPRDVHISRATIKISLKPGPEDILASFKSKTRYNIRLAERKGVTVQAVAPTAKNLDVMYELLRQTQLRAGFLLRSKQYFLDYWQAQTEAGQGQLFFANHNGKVLAGAFVTMFDGKAWYKDGGSLREHNELMAPYFLQWEVMRWLKLNGVKTYDLVGVSPDGKSLTGITHFKEGFGGQMIKFIGTWDLPLNDAKYAFWNRLGERLTLSYHHRAKKSLWY